MRGAVSDLLSAPGDPTDRNGRSSRGVAMAEMESPYGSQRAGHVWPEWYGGLAAYRNPDNWKAAGQLANTLLPYFALWYLMVRSLQLGYPYPVTLLLALPAAALLVRIFILFHDCVHGSFFSAKGANTFCGYLCGLLVFTSFENWRFSHLRHHATYANLDTRGYGDIWTMTRSEYAGADRTTRWQYRLYRNPLVMFPLGALYSFLLGHRLPTRNSRRAERMSVLLTNLLLLGISLLVSHFIGWRIYLLVQIPVLGLAGAAGIWLFYVQHQFSGVYWARKEEWNPLRAAMEGSSFYRLPPLLRWFSGNIGYHHIHHLGPRIPNYRLRACFAAIPALNAKAPLTLAASLSAVRLKLWDEEAQQLVAFD